VVNHSDDQFKEYLRQFHPVEPDPLPKGHQRVRGTVAQLAWAAVIVMIGAISLTIFLRAHRTQSSSGVGPTKREVSADRLVSSKPLTIRSADALLATAPSFEEAIDEMTAAPETVPLPKDKHSALAILSKGPTKL
jgi:hypothetical protein